jgi:hypothetical protein
MAELRKIDSDNLEVTDTVTVKRSDLDATKVYIEAEIVRLQAKLAEVTRQIAFLNA